MNILSSSSPSSRHRNAILRLLSDEEFAAVASCADKVGLRARDVMATQGTPVQHVFFPYTCVLSVLSYMSNGVSTEIGTIGNEGFSGVELLTGAPLAMQTTICQIPGACLKMPAEDFKALAQRPSFRQVLNHSLVAYLAQLAQSIACNRLHSVEQRFARWMLLTCDRVGSEFFLTQEFLADMLGVHRPSVSLVAEALQQEGIIKYHRGRISILDRPGLEKRSCECYGMLGAQMRRMHLLVPHALNGEQADVQSVGMHSRRNIQL